MNVRGLSLASRYCYPPNSLSLCGPKRQTDLLWYSATQQTDLGTHEIIKKFSTLYPYLCFIAGENNLKDPYDPRVIEAYWIGNSLTRNINSSDFLHFLNSDLIVPKKIPKKAVNVLKQKVAYGALPHHSFHVLNVYHRTGNLDIPYTIETMDACLINCGVITAIESPNIIVETRPLWRKNNLLSFGQKIHRKLQMQGAHDSILPSLTIGDWVSYHWGYVCEKLTVPKRKNLVSYTQYSLAYANTTIWEK